MVGLRSDGCVWAAVALLTMLATAGCGPKPRPSPTVPPSAYPQAAATSQISDYGFPAAIDPGRRYLFYLHGRIIEDQGLPAISPEFGEYQYASILRAFEGHGLAVISEQRPKDTDAGAYAERVRGQVGRLLEAGVPSGSITIVGASKGASIAAYASYLLENAGLNYVLLGSCHPSMVDEWKQRGMWLHGNVLAIYDYADAQYSGSCEELFGISEGRGLGRHKEIVLQVGTGHGILYKPLDQWVVPVVDWAER